jgi:hypothetical protein
MKLAVVAGGWHWPAHFFRSIASQANGADLFAIAHRHPELPIVREEKREILEAAAGPLADLDRLLYSEYPTTTQLRSMGWQYSEAPNSVGDWGFFNQWLDRRDYREYDVILNCHDDTYIRRQDLFDHLDGDWLLLANGSYPQQPAAYVRGSFEFWKREMLDMLGGRIDLGEVTLTREGKTDTPAGLSGITAWNSTCVPLRQFMANRGLSNKIAYLSPYYRISAFAIEGERGFMHWQDGCPWSFEAGLKEYPL